MELVKVTNIGLQLHNGPVIPVIRAVFKDISANSYNSTQANAFMREIYAQALGMTSAVSCYTNVWTDRLQEFGISGTFDLGDNGGLYLHYVLGGRNGMSQIIRANPGFYYQSRQVSTAFVTTGYESHEYSHLVIITDEDYNLYYSAGSAILGILIRSTSNLGPTVVNGCPVCLLDTSGTYYDSQNSWQLYPVNYNIRNDVVNEIDPTKTDPYDDVPTAGIGGGQGSHDWSSSDIIDFPGNPGTSAVNTGFISLWSPTEQQMLNLSGYMWNADVLTIDFWKRLWADPLSVIYGLNIIPIDLRAAGRNIIGGTDSVVVGLVNTNVQMDYLTEQWIELDCGSLSLAEVWGAYLDYDPYTKLEIYLPYCGVHPLRVDDFMSGTISLKYKIDLLSGACVALIKADKPNDDDNDLSAVVYQFMGNCATQVPVTASQYADTVRSVISLAASIGTLVATGAGGAAAAAAGATSTASKAALAERTIHNSAAVVENVMGIKPGIERSGAIGSAAGLLGVQTPYLIITRPRQAHPIEQNKFTGYPAFITETLGDLEGWTIIKDIHLENIACTADELTEIDGLLKSGVIF
mgnify:CR=1 FL=1